MADNITVKDAGGANVVILTANNGTGHMPYNVVVGETTVFDFTPSMHTSALDAGDVAADTEIVTAICRANDRAITLTSLFLIDKADQKAELDIYFFSGSGTLGTEGAAPSISDANAALIQGYLNVPNTAYKDLGGVSVAQVTVAPMVLKPPSGADDIYIGILNGAGTPTYAADSLVLRLGVYRD